MDGRFDRINAERQQKAAYRKTREDLLRQVEEATTLDEVKGILIRVIKVSVK